MAKLDANRIEAILRVNKMHEPECAIFGFLEKVKGHRHKNEDFMENESEKLENSPPPQCNCWLSEPA